MIKKIGFAGAGTMGIGMIKNLLSKGYEVTSFDVNPKALKKVEELGSKTVNKVGEIAKDADAVVMSLPSPDIVRETVVEILNVLNEGTYILDMSTTDPSTTRELSQEAAKKNISFLDSPVSGGPEGADAGTLAIMVGGKKKAFEDVKGLYDTMGANIFYIGESGTAQVVKLAHNMVAATNLLSLAEALLFSVKGGVDAKVVADVISKSAGRSGTLDIFVKPIVLENNYKNPKFMLKHMHKDLRLYMDAAKSFNSFSAIGSLTYNFYVAALNNYDGNLDFSVVCKVIESLNNDKIVKKDEKGEKTI